MLALRAQSVLIARELTLYSNTQISKSSTKSIHETDIRSYFTYWVVGLRYDPDHFDRLDGGPSEEWHQNTQCSPGTRFFSVACWLLTPTATILWPFGHLEFLRVVGHFRAALVAADDPGEGGVGQVVVVCVCAVEFVAVSLATVQVVWRDAAERVDAVQTITIEHPAQQLGVLPCRIFWQLTPRSALISREAHTWSGRDIVVTAHTIKWNIHMLT